MTSAEICSFDGVFSPTLEGQKSACLKIASNDPDTPILNVPFGDDSTQCDGDITTTTITNGGICLSELIYGSFSGEAEILRSFRDDVLIQTPEGREIIRLYYEWSPAIVKAMEADEEFKDEVKEMIDGVLGLVGGETEYII